MTAILLTVWLVGWAAATVLLWRSAAGRHGAPALAVRSLLLLVCWPLVLLIAWAHWRRSGE